MSRTLTASIVLAAAAISAAPSLSLAQSIETLWKNNCMNCHAEDGHGGGAGTRTLLTDDLFLQAHDRPFFDAIKKGLPDKGMAPFGETLKDEQIWGLVNYIRELQGRERRRRLGSISRKLDKNGVCTTQHADFTIETVADKGLSVPWSVDFVPFKDGEAMLVTNRPGTISIYKDGKPAGAVDGLPHVRNQGQGGLLDITVHPRFKDGDDWIYLSFSDPQGDRDEKGITKIVRGKISHDGDKWTWNNQQTVFQARPEHYVTGDIHFGSKIVFDPKDPHILFFGIGERGRGEMAQDLTRPNGKIHRLRDDGSIPSDNPFVGQKDAYPSIWSFGHRNPQGLAFDLAGNLWDTEHGPRGGDEFNLILKGRNYGWPLVTFGINYNGSALVTPWPDTAGPDVQAKNIMMPIDRWMPSIAACGLDVVKSDKFPDWKGDMLAGGLAGAVVDRIRVASTAVVDPANPGKAAPARIVEREEVVQGLGRVRDVVSAPDGFIYIVLNDPDKVVRLVPASPTQK